MVTVAEYDGGCMCRIEAYKEAKAYLERATREVNVNSFQVSSGVCSSLVPPISHSENLVFFHNQCECDRLAILQNL